MQEAVPLLNELLLPHVVKWATMSVCSIQRSITHWNKLQMWFLQQLCEQTDGCLGEQLSCNNVVSVPAPFHTLGRKYFGNKFHVEWTGQVGMIILWSLWGLDITTCDNYFGPL